MKFEEHFKLMIYVKMLLIMWAVIAGLGSINMSIMHNNGSAVVFAVFSGFFAGLQSILKEL